MFYDRFEELCKEKGVKPGRACTEMGVSRSLAAKWKATGTEKPSADALEKMSIYFGKSIEEILSGKTKKAPAQEGERKLTDREIKAAFLGGLADGLSEEAIDRYWNDAKGYIGYKIQQDKNKTD